MDVMAASHADLVALVERQAALITELQATIAAQQVTISAQQQQIARLERRIQELDRPGSPSRGMPGHKPGPAPASGARPARRKRVLQFTRPRSQPTQRITHALGHCPQCAIPLAGGAVKRTREVLELALAPATITEHVYLQRCCPGCGRRHTPRVELDGVVVGQSRLGVNLVSLIATLREEARLPLRAIQTYLASVHGLALSVGALVGALRQVERAGQAALAALRTAVQAGPVVHADETGWREAGRNGYVWTFSTPDSCLFVHGGRGKGMVDHVLVAAHGVLVSDFYAAYDHYPGAQQKCWAHLLRDVHDLRVRDPTNATLAGWAAAVQALYDRAVAASQALSGVGVDALQRQQLRHTLMAELAALCQPYLADETAAQATLCRRIMKYRHALFTFVLDPAVPPTNNAAERSLRHLVVARKVSGGTRSAEGTTTRLALASLFGSWRLRGLNPYQACRQLLSSPQP